MESFKGAKQCFKTSAASSMADIDRYEPTPVAKHTLTNLRFPWGQMERGAMKRNGRLGGLGRRHRDLTLGHIHIDHSDLGSISYDFMVVWLNQIWKKWPYHALKIINIYIY